MSDKKYNHYVPRFYLTNFSGNKNFIDKCILSSRKIIRCAPMGSTGGKKYLYGKDGVVENIFAEMEGRWDSIVKKIILTESIPSSSEDYTELLLFIILSENRTLAVANHNMAFWGEHYRAMARLLKENGRMDIPDTVINRIGAECEIPNLQNLKNAIFLMELCTDLQMSIIKNNSPLPFVTSDHPVMKYNQLFISNKYYSPYGYGQIGIQIFFPISPNLCLVLFDPITYQLHNYHDNKFITNDPTIIRSINTLTVGYAYQELYFSSSTSDRTINKILAKRVADGLSPATGSQRVGNGFLIMISDPSYLHRVNIPLFSIFKPFREISLSQLSASPIRPHAKEVKEKDEGSSNYS